MSLRSSIRETEHRIALRHARIGVAVGGVTNSAGRRMISPGALVAAALFGVALHRSERLHGLRILALIQAANAGLRLLLNLFLRSRAVSAGR